MKGAIISPDGLFRYLLWRVWNAELPICLWVMLNPSTADADLDDATILKITRFVQPWGGGGFYVANLYAYRTCSPDILKAAGYPVGPDNLMTLRSLLWAHEHIVGAWGSHAEASAVEWFRCEAALYKREICCLSRNKDGNPGHPLYLRESSRLLTLPRWPDKL